ncbi:hypothetical protein KGM48_00905 [Patescibacteria group bacterium]|nr:hypothetical protein [Patescibacteria group bacterium]
MPSLLLILGTIALLGGFIAMTAYETGRGSRFFSARRARLDRLVERISFIIEHVDFAAFLRDELRHLAHRIGHDIAHLSLQIVRAIERILTRLVRSFRVREAGSAPRESTRAFVKTLSDFKEHLKATAPEIPKI